ncbi:MAG TPA: PEGA domain-containing protein, partial [Kofleriaceae bacterium]
RFNMAECLISLDQPLEAYEHVIAALVYGEAALGPEHHERAVRTRTLLEGQLAHVEVSCAEAGAVVTLDGQPLFIAPGTAKRTLLPGTHQIVASKPGYQTLTREDVLIPRKTVVAKLELLRLRTFEYRWARWKPWAVVGGGVAVSLLGLVFRYQAQAKYDEFGEDLGEVCPFGCVRDDVPADVREIEASGDRYNSLAKTSYVIGGIGIVAGAVLVLLNGERAVETPLPQTVRVDGRSASFVWNF